uniref:Uncharacterized protein n=1 Tax=Oryza punctata TaxID=4537 RepID=A0A0E0MLA8_ORYPU
MCGDDGMNFMQGIVQDGSVGLNNIDERDENEVLDQVGLGAEQDILEEVDQNLDETNMIVEPTTQEEKEMDKMFQNDNYPTVSEIADATAPEKGMEFDSRNLIPGMLLITFLQTMPEKWQRGPGDRDNASRQKKSNTIIKTKCEVRMQIKMNGTKWLVTLVDLKHNHPLVPPKWLVKFMHCHKNMTEQEREFIQILQKNKVPPRKIMTIFRSLRGSFRNIPFDAKDLSNIRTKERKKHRNKDIEELLGLFKKVQNKTLGLPYRLQLDDDGTVRSVFWTDLVGRMNYKMFGDYVSFDTTFSTNMYNQMLMDMINKQKGINDTNENIDNDKGTKSSVRYAIMMSKMSQDLLNRLKPINERRKRKLSNDLQHLDLRLN